MSFFVMDDMTRLNSIRMNRAEMSGVDSGSFTSKSRFDTSTPAGLRLLVTGTFFPGFSILAAGIRTVDSIFLSLLRSSNALWEKQSLDWHIVRTTSYAPKVHNHIRDSARSSRPISITDSANA